MSEIIVEFTPTPEEYRKSTMAFSSKNFWLWFLSGWLGIPTIILVIISWITLGIAATHFTSSVVAIALGFVLIMYPYFGPANAMRQAIRDKRLCMPVKYIFDDEEILVKSDGYDLKYKWNNLERIAESSLFYHLVHNDAQVQFVPKRAFENSEVEDKFRNMIIAHFSKMEVLEKGIVGWKLAFVSGLISFLVNYSVSTMIGD
jgi:hypothetical protein